MNRLPVLRARGKVLNARCSSPYFSLKKIPLIFFPVALTSKFVPIKTCCGLCLGNCSKTVIFYQRCLHVNVCFVVITGTQIRKQSVNHRPMFLNRPRSWLACEAATQPKPP